VGIVSPNAKKHDYDIGSPSDSLDLSDGSLWTVDGWRKAGGTVYAAANMYVATAPGRLAICCGLSEEEAISSAITVILEERAKRKRHGACLGHLFVDEKKNSKKKK
jgi:hypothetical protein